MPKIYLSPSVESYNACVFGDNEQQHSDAFIDAVIPYLDAAGITWKRNTSGNAMQGVTESNAWKPDIHYAIGTNAGQKQSRYSVLYVYDTSEESPAMQLASQIKKYRSKIYDKPIYLNQSRSMTEILRTEAPCVYDVIAFHDNKEDANFFHTHMDELAAALCHAFCDYFGVPFQTPVKPTSTKLTEETTVMNQAEETMKATEPTAMANMPAPGDMSPTAGTEESWTNESPAATEEWGGEPAAYMPSAPVANPAPAAPEWTAGDTAPANMEWPAAGEQNPMADLVPSGFDFSAASEWSPSAYNTPPEAWSAMGNGAPVMEGCDNLLELYNAEVAKHNDTIAQLNDVLDRLSTMRTDFMNVISKYEN